MYSWLYISDLCLSGEWYVFIQPLGSEQVSISMDDNGYAKRVSELFNLSYIEWTGFIFSDRKCQRCDTNVKCDEIFGMLLFLSVEDAHNFVSPVNFPKF